MLPEPYDRVLFSPDATDEMALPERHAASGRRAFAFLSVFKWEERKGWDVLLRAYLAEFAREDEVVLYLRVSTDDGNKAELSRWLATRFPELCEYSERIVADGATVSDSRRSDENDAHENHPPGADAAAGSRHVGPGGDGTIGGERTSGGDGKPPRPRTKSHRCDDSTSKQWQRAPPIVLLDESIPQVCTRARARPSFTQTRAPSFTRACDPKAQSSALGSRPSPLVSHWILACAQAELPSLYKAVDAFVLPTRGEGWGRPVVEAMSMGLPAIVTNWSGVTAFLSSATGYPLPYELVPSPVADGHYWAEPSASALRGLMRRVVERPHEAKAIGAAARAHVATHYSQQAVAEQLVYATRAASACTGCRRLG